MVKYGKGGSTLIGKTGATVAPKDNKYSFEKKLVTVAVISAVLTFSGCTAASLYELVTLDQVFTIGDKVVIRAIGQKPAKQNERMPAPHKLLSLVPREIDHYDLEAYQKVPGEQKYAAEAIYKQNRNDAAIPFNNYVKVTFFEHASEADKTIKETLSLRYPVQVQTQMRDNFKVHSGRDQEGGGYYLASIINRYLVEVHTNYLHAVPADPEPLFDASAWEVFDEVSTQVDNVTSNKK